jgi:hypothetical protein
MTTPEKMTDEALTLALRSMTEKPCDWVENGARCGARYESNCPACQATERVRAHIAALTAERDGWERVAGTNAESALAAQGERDALRERVQALEAWGSNVCDALDLRWQPPDATLWTRLGDVTLAERLLAAIRQRAGDGVILARLARGAVGVPAASLANSWREMTDLAQQQWSNAGLAVARYLLGEDATGAAQEPATEQGPECATCQERGDFERLCCKGPQASVSALEPTTAEAFATLHAVVDDHLEHLEAVRISKAALALLERRMGAQEGALRQCAETPTGCVWCGEFDHRDKCVIRAALTDAPPVFTLEEVDGVLRRALGPTRANSLAMEFAALRKVTP